MRNRTVRILLASAALVLLTCTGIVVYAVYRVARPYASSADVNAELAKIRARGEPLSLRDLAGPKVPGDQNAAVIYQKAFALLPDGSGDRGAPSLRRLLREAERSESAKAWDQVSKIVSSHGRVLRITRQAAERPKCSFPKDVTQDGFPDVPYAAKLRTLVMLTSADAMLQARRGDGARAMDSLEISLRVGESLRDEYGLIQQLVRIALVRTNLRALRYVLQSHRPNAEQARRLDSLLAGIDLDRGLARALQAERVTGLNLYEKLRKDGLKALDELSQGPGDAPLPRVPGVPVNAALRMALRPDEAHFLKQMDTQIRTAHLSYREAKERGLIRDSPDGAPKFVIISRILLPVFERARIARDLAEVEVQGNRIVLALLVHRSRSGTYPASLADLKVSASILEDPFSGKELVYKRAGWGFLLYSFGPDLDDDGGEQADWTGRSSTDRPGDIVWRFER